MTVFYVLVGVFVFALIIVATLVALSLDRRASLHDIQEEPLRSPTPPADPGQERDRDASGLPPRYVEV